LVAASIDTDVLLSVSRCAAPPVPSRDLFTRCEWELLKIRGRSNGAANLPALGSCQRISRPGGTAWRLFILVCRSQRSTFEGSGARAFMRRRVRFPHPTRRMDSPRLPHPHPRRHLPAPDTPRHRQPLTTSPTAKLRGIATGGLRPTLTPAPGDTDSGSAGSRSGVQEQESRGNVVEEFVPGVE
jgi:hypothetical protein